MLSNTIENLPKFKIGQEVEVSDIAGLPGLNGEVVVIKKIREIKDTGSLVYYCESDYTFLSNYTFLPKHISRVHEYQLKTMGNWTKIENAEVIKIIQ